MSKAQNLPVNNMTWAYFLGIYLSNPAPPYTTIIVLGLHPNINYKTFCWEYRPGSYYELDLVMTL